MEASSLHFFEYTAIAASVIFLCQIILCLNGICPLKVNPKKQGDFSLSHHKFRIIIIRNSIGFIFSLSWSIILLYKYIPETILLIIISLLAAIIFIATFNPILTFACNRGKKNSFILDDIIENVGEVYITIPPENKGKGKILLSFRGQIYEYDAITFSGKPIERGKIVTITGMQHSVLIVSIL